MSISSEYTALQAINKKKKMSRDVESNYLATENITVGKDMKMNL